MLAYVFWHAPAPGADGGGYERLLAAFHRELAAAPPPGFAGSAAYSVGPLPWLAGDVYEDWYAVERWEDLGALNDAAVDARRSIAHDAAARAAGEGVGGVYRLRAGTAAVAVDGPAVWMRKPRGVPYPQFRSRLAEAVGEAGGLWERQMLLGPAPEYCAVGADAGRATLEGPVVQRRRIYG